MPDWKSYIRERLAGLRLPAAREGEIAEELAQHLEDCYAEALRRGLSEAEARARAETQFPDLAALAEEVRRAERPVAGRVPPRWEAKIEERTRRWGVFTDLLQDIRYGVRLLVKSPGFTAIAVLTLALGIGANTAIFSVVHGVLLKPLPYPAPEGLLRIWQHIPTVGYARSGLSEGQFLALRDTNKSLEHVGAYLTGFGNLTTDAGTERILISRASQGTFEALRVQPVIGRLFRREEEVSGNAGVAILSHAFWQRHHGGRESALGEIIRFGDLAFTVIGVMPADFRLPNDLESSEPVQLWLPTPLDPARINWGSYYLGNVVARRKAGVSAEQARAEVEAIFAGVRQPHEESMIERGNLILHAEPLHADLVGGVSRALWVLFAAVGVILLIACANLASLLLARGATRQKEIAVRAALGAGRARIIRQLLTESALLAVAGGVAGTLLAWWSIGLLASLNPGNVPRLRDVTLSTEVLAFTLGASLLAAVLFGLVPGFQALRLDLNRSLREEGRGLTAGAGHARLRRMLVAGEVALAVVVVVCAGLLVRTLDRLLAIPPGFRVENLLSVEVSLPLPRYREAARVASFYDEILERIRALPGVTAAAAASRTPLAGFGSDTVFDIEGRPTAAERVRGGEGGSLPHAGYRQVTAGYLEAMGIPLIVGRSFRDSDTAGAPLVVMINQTAASRHWPNANPLGQRVRFYRSIEEVGPWAEIVGIFGDTRVNQLNEDAKEEVLMVHAQGQATGGWTANTSTLVVRTAADPAALAPAVRAELRTLDSSVPVFNVRTFEEVVARTVAQPRFNAVLLGSFALLAILLAAVGIYGVLASHVAHRRHEFGVRLALGAQPADILRLVLRQGLRLTFIGLAAGLAGALAATRLVASLLFGVSPHDPLTFAGVASLLLGVALASCWIPARRATKVDPMVALRYE